MRNLRRGPTLFGMACVKVQDEVTIVEFGPRYESLDDALLMEDGGLLLGEAYHADPPKLLLDLSQTGFIGSRFIELMVRAWKRLQQRGGKMVLCGLQPFCADVLRTTKLDTIWDIRATRQEGLAALAGRA